MPSRWRSTRMGLLGLAAMVALSACTAADHALVRAGSDADNFVGGASKTIMVVARPLALADLTMLVTTKKTIIDQAMSFTTGEDCSSVRAWNGGTYCETPYVNHPPVAQTLYCYRTLAAVTCYDRPMPYDHLVAIRPGGRQTVY